MKDVLLIDCAGFASIALNESSGGSCKFRGKFQEANETNKNKRMYTYDILESNREKLMETVKAKGLYGELDQKVA